VSHFIEQAPLCRSSTHGSLALGEWRASSPPSQAPPLPRLDLFFVRLGHGLRLLGICGASSLRRFREMHQRWQKQIPWHPPRFRPDASAASKLDRVGILGLRSGRRCLQCQVQRMYI